MDYKAIQKRNPQKPKEEMKRYAQIVLGKEVDRSRARRGN